MPVPAGGPWTLRRVVALVAALNLAYFGIEFTTALVIGSVSLLADGVDFLEDAAVNFLIAMALAWSPRRRARVGMALAWILLVPAAAFLWSLWGKLLDPVPPAAVPLGLTGLGALAVNVTCAALLLRHRHHAGSLGKAAFLSARNDVLVNASIIAAAVLTAVRPSIWPDVVVGVGVAVLNVGAARDVWRAARMEHAESLLQP